MREPGRDIALTEVLCGKHHADPLAEGRRTAANVNRDVEDLAVQYGDQFALRRRFLIMEAAQNSFSRERQVVLHERRGNAGHRIAGLAPGLEKQAASVTENPGLDHENTRQPGGNHIHGASPWTW